MTHEEAIEYMENEIRCIKRSQICERDCARCDLVKEDEPLIEAYNLAISALDLINRQQEQLEAAIAGQETLQKALAKKDREVSVLNSDLKLLKNNYNYLKTNFDETVEKNKRLRDKVVGLTAEKDRLIKTFGECQERAIKDFAKAVIDGFADGKISRVFDMVDFTYDYLRGKMAGEG